MSFGPSPVVSAHATQGNPLAARRDRDSEAARSKVPQVPRAPRAKPRHQSAGAMARAWDLSNQNSRSSTPTKASEGRRPRDESPFTHARVNLLKREKESVENQVFEVGPPRRPSSAGKKDHSRGHPLGRQIEANQGMPWVAVPKELEEQPARGRRHTLLHERNDADQALEWVPECCLPSGTSNVASGGYHGRVSMLKREQLDAETTLDTCAGKPPVAPACHARRNVLAREQAGQGTSSEMPAANGHELGGEVPVYHRRNLLAREQAVISAF